MHQSVIDILEELEATPGRLAKEAIMMRHKGLSLLRRTFIAAQDPYTVYYVNKFKLPPALPEARYEDDDVLEQFINSLLTNLSTRVITGNAAKLAVNTIFGVMTSLQQKWCQRILLKNMRCGVSESIVNKTWPGTLNPFQVQLANTLKTIFIEGKGLVILDSINYPVMIEPKLDGLRCVAIKSNGIVSMYTRNGTELETMPTIKNFFQKYMPDDSVFDGEGLALDWNQSSSVMMSTKNKKDDKNLIFNMFDILPLVEWKIQTTKRTLRVRRQKMMDAIVLMKQRALEDDERFVPVTLVKNDIVNNEVELRKLYVQALDDNYEGIMIKDPEADYEWDRSDAVLKMKPSKTWEGVIVGARNGNRGTKRENHWGKFDIVLPNGVVTTVGSGFNDAFHAMVELEGRDAWMGRVLEVEGQPDPATVDGLTVDGKIRFPRFKRVRDPNDVDPLVIEAGKEYMKKHAV